MKKVLLSLSMLAATVFATNAQKQLVLWNASTGTTDIVAAAPYAFKGSGLANDTAKTSPHLIHGTGSTTGYYVGGYGMGTFASANVGQPWGISATDLNAYKLNIQFKSTGTGSKVKIQFSSTASTDSYGLSVDLTSGATLNALTLKSFPLSSFSKIGGSPNYDPDGVNFMTAAFAAGIYKIEFAVNAAGQTGNVDLTLGNIFFSTSTTLGTASAAANIASTKLFPNPATSDFTAEIVLKNNASVSVVLSDMTGRQIATKAVDNNGDANFQTAGLVAGMYTVTYVIDGTPAKTELVVVK
jgi:hypothetical protein